MTVARPIVAGRTYLISRRCVQRQFLLRPDPMVERIYLYCLGEAAARYGITLNGYEQMGNHHHLIARDNHGNLPEFLCHLHAMVAKSMNAYRGRWENFWATEQVNVVYLVDADDRFAKLIYLLTNPVADHLVERTSDWPGASSFGQSLSGRDKMIERPRGFFRKHGNMPAAVELRIERPDGFEGMSEEAWRDKLLTAVRAVEDGAREERRTSQRGIVGRKTILRMDPTDSPKTTELRRNLRPFIACLNPERRIHELAALLAFRLERQHALERLKRGEGDVAFPLGTYRIRGVFSSTPANAAAA